MLSICTHTISVSFTIHWWLPQ